MTLSESDEREPADGISRSRGVSDRATVAAAVAAAVGAWRAAAVPVLVAVVVLAGALIWRRAVVVVLAVGLLTTSLANRVWAGLGPADSRPWDGVAAIVSDPERVQGATHLLVEVDGQRLDVWARGEPARALRSLSSGDRIHLRGAISPLAADQQRWLAPQRVVGRLAVTDAGQMGRTPRLWRLANGARALLARGSASLPREQRALLAGLVLGDDRDQSDRTREAFRAAGLTHLLAVSGQNVAFVLAVASPLLRRLGGRVRWLATLVLLCFFAVVTRFEPSVIRATLMAGLAVTAAARGRPTSGVRLLSLATIAALVYDPLLVHRTGFQLSVLATAGIIVAARRLAAILPGPRPLALAVAVTVGAQVATAPLLVAQFGGVPLAALPANILAEPAAGAAMTYGLAAGLVAGVVGGRAAWLLHLPTRLLLGWIDLVARRSAAAGLGNVTAWQVALALVALLGLTIKRRAGLNRRARAGGGETGRAT